ncbi:hypothetical protein BH09MYX1_BH09MYX1_56120 [soil metagenome]
MSAEAKSKLSEQEMLDVMAYVDGELEGEDAERVEALLDSSDDARELRASFGELSERVRELAKAPSIDVTRVVLAKVAPNELDRARINKASRTRMLVVGATFVALAAAVTLYVKHGDPVGTGTAQAQTASSTVTTGPTSPTETSSSAPIAALHGVQVDSVDTASASRSVSVFYVPNSDEPSDSTQSVVVWIDDSASGGN